MVDVVVATTERVDFAELAGESKAMVAALGRAGVSAVLRAWHDDRGPWSDAQLVLVRTTWDYPDHLPEFESWLRALEAADVQVVNPVAAMRWNLRKSYLLDLAAHGAAIIPVELAPAGSTLEPAGHVRVMKPQVGAGSSGARLVAAGERIEVPYEAVVNPFLPKVAGGERSVFVVEGRVVSVFRKTPSPDDWRVQTEWGGRYELEDDVPTGVIEAGLKAYDVTDAIVGRGTLCYLRVDLIEREDGEWLVVEVEGIEPSLYLAVTPAVGDAVAVAVRRRLARPPPRSDRLGQNSEPSE